MLPFINQISLIRYLIVWRVNSSLVLLPRCLSTELSQALGTIIANRLPTQVAREWRRALDAWGDVTSATSQSKSLNGPIPETAWPIEAVLFAYPGKRTYGQGEVILWELKLMGASADHGLFLEFILPAMEEAATIVDSPWHHAKSLWGHFDIQAVYVARGLRWEPLVVDGRLDLDYRANSTQWAEDLVSGQKGRRRRRHMRWITPFDLGEMPDASPSPSRPRPQDDIPASEIPTLQGILDALISRMTVFMPNKHQTPEDVWALVDPEEQTQLWHALQQAPAATQPRLAFKPVPKYWPGRWMGAQTFEVIPPRMLPYLEIASILHLGKQTHFGCGTFRLD
jgi:hypothetical protein